MPLVSYKKYSIGKRCVIGVVYEMCHWCSTINTLEERDVSYVSYNNTIKERDVLLVSYKKYTIRKICVIDVVQDIL